MDTRHEGRTVVVGVDGSEWALRAVRWGAAEAGRRGLPLRLVIAFDWPATHFARHPDRERRYRDALLHRARGHLAEAVEVAEKEGLGIVVEQQLVVSGPLTVLGAESERAQLVVIGDRGLSRIEGLLVGSVAAGLTVHASCPVVVVRGPQRSPSDAGWPVVVGVDGTPTSDAAVRFAFRAAAARHVPLVAVHAWSDGVFDPGLAAGLVDWSVVEAAEQQVLAERVGLWALEYPGVPVETVVTRDGPAHSLIDRAAGAQLLVVGSRGRGEFTGLILGSVGHALLHRSPCPVAVVRP